MYAPSRAAKYVEKTDRTERRGKSATVVGDFNIPLSTTDNTTRQKISKDTEKQHHQPTGYNLYL